MHGVGLWHSYRMTDAPGTPSEPSTDASDAPPVEAVTEQVERRERLKDAQAFGLFAAWLVFRFITQRIGLGAPKYLLKNHPYVIPLLNNSFPLIIITGTGVAGRPGMFVASVATSVFLSTLVALILYWAGWRFGHRLAQMSQRPGSPWAGVWNPKQIERAERFMDKWGVGAVIVARITELFILPLTLVAGASEMRFRRFIIANTVGAVGFAGLWLWVGTLAVRRFPWIDE